VIAFIEGTPDGFLAAAIAFTLFLIVAVAVGLRAAKARPVSGPEGLIGMRGKALTRLAPDQVGQIFVRGEIWEALPVSRDTRVIAPDEWVQVVRLDGLTARVIPAEAP
jgi:membrane protein implicated in regulation of membrane protease activity